MMKKLRREPGTGWIKATEIGRINRNIETSVSDVFQGTHGAAGKALNLAKKREQYLYFKPTRKKLPA